MKPVFPLLTLLITFLLFGSACQKIDDLNGAEISNYEAEFAVPIFSASAKMEDLLEKVDSTTIITFTEEGLIKLNYFGDIEGKTSTEIFNVFNEIPVPLTDTLVKIALELPDEIDLNFLTFKSGTIFMTAISNHEQDVTVTFEIPQLTKNGNIFSKTFLLNYNGSVPVQNSPIFDVSGYTLTTTDDSLQLRYIAIKEDMQRDTLAVIGFITQDFQFDYVEGYLGQQLYEIERDTIEIDVFQSWTNGQVYFEDPRIFVTVNNSFGFPVRSMTNVLDIFSVNGDVLPLESSFIDNGIDFAYPSLSEVGETKVTVFDFNKDNSNIREILAFGPVALDYDLDALGNPDQNTAIEGFMTCESEFLVQVEVELPIFGWATDFTLQDTIEGLDLQDQNNIKEVEFKLVTENELPLSVDLQLYFTDENFVVIDSLLDGTERVLSGAPVDGDGNAMGISEKITIKRVEAARYDRIKNASNILRVVELNTSALDDLSVKVLGSQKVDIRMGMKIVVEE